MLVVTVHVTVVTVILLFSAPCKCTYVVDVGFNVGQDTAMYLEAGYHVAAVEANPRLVEWARRTEPFSTAVASGWLTLLNRVVTSEKEVMGNATFFMSSHTERSKYGVCYRPPCTAVNVETSTCDTFVHDFRPEYIKIDAEGADLMCIEAILREVQLGSIQAPKYISIEASLTPSLFKAARSAGYEDFKYSDQTKNHGGHMHGAGTGAFGEFVFDPQSKYAWQNLTSIQKQRRVGDLHMKHSSAWMHRASNDMMLMWKHPATWPLV
jgi:FkbM family methyltransferase